MHTKLERIQADIEKLAEFSCVKGIGCTRYTYTGEFAAARDYIMEEMRKAGLKVRENEIGMVVGRLEGRNPDAPVVMTGSHFDTVKTGGRFDGAAGVVAAMEAARVFHDEGFVPECPIEFVALPEEEGSRFGSGLFGSRAMCGALYPDELNVYKDSNGISVADAMRSYGLDPEKAGNVVRDPKEMKAFVELHIEQGPLLENTKTDIGVVEAIVGLRTMNVTVNGRSDHAGNTPMNMRADTMLAAAKAMVAATERALEIGDGTVVTFGKTVTDPGVFNIVAKQTVFQVDCRSRTIEAVDDVYSVIRASLEKSAAENPGLSFIMEEMLSAMPVQMDGAIKTIMYDEAEKAGISACAMLSGAGHDAMIMAKICPVAMIFVPSHNGASHVPEEWTEYADLQKGVEVLCGTLRSMCS